MLAAITGGTGFVGRHLVALHSKLGDQVRVLTRDSATAQAHRLDATLYEGDLTNPSADLRSFLEGVDVLYHCAAELRDPSKMNALNVGGTKQLLSAATGRIGRWVQLSSVGVFSTKGKLVVDEVTPCRPSNIYEQTKLLADQSVERLCRRYEIPFCIVRPSIVFGPDMTNRSLRQWVQLIRRHSFAFIGSPDAMVNVEYVDNVAEALRICGYRKESADQSYIVSETATVEEFTGMICNALGRRPVKLRVPERAARQLANLFGTIPGFPLTHSRIDALTNRTVFTAKKIREALGFRPNVSLEEGVSRTIDAWINA